MRRLPPTASQADPLLPLLLRHVVIVKTRPPLAGAPSIHLLFICQIAAVAVGINRSLEPFCAASDPCAQVGGGANPLGLLPPHLPPAPHACVSSAPPPPSQPFMLCEPQNRGLNPLQMVVRWCALVLLACLAAGGARGERWQGSTYQRETVGRWAWRCLQLCCRQRACSLSGMTIRLDERWPGPPMPQPRCPRLPTPAGLRCLKAWAT